MKRRTLTTAVMAGIGGVAGLAGIANAVNLNQDGLGQVLIYPYFTVNGGNQTLLSIVNTTDRVKAVKVRYLEAWNSREVLDFNLYLSPFDVWTASIFSISDDGPGNLVTRDNSCTVPDIIGQTALAPPLPVLGSGDRYVPFRNFQYTGANNDEGPDSLTRAREGHFEMIEMAEINNDTANDSASAATHTGGIPNNCQQLNAAWGQRTPGVPLASEYWVADPNVDTDPPAGGLFGSASIINGGEGTQVSFDADAINAFFETVTHTNPGSTQPSLSNADFDSDADGFVNSIVFDPATGLAVSSDWDRGIDAVSAVYMHNEIYNEYALDSSLDASTEWVITFPTKNAYVDEVIVGMNARAPFTDIFSEEDAAGDGACEIFDFQIYNREEEQPFIGGGGFSPPAPGGATGGQLCFEVNTVKFDDGLGGGSGIFASLIESTFSGVFENGWVSIDFAAQAGRTLTDEDGDVYSGLPVTGFSAQVLKNNNFGATTIANYAGLFRHKSDRDIIDL